MYPTSPEPGVDVGCDYGRVRGGQTANGAESKFTIFVVKAQAGMTLNDAFKHYQTEMHGTYPNGRVRGEVVSPQTIHVQKSDGTEVTLPPVQSEADELAVDNRQYVNELVVSLISGWIIEIRSTYPSEFVGGDPATGIDIPASSFIWATAMREFATAAATK